MTMKEILNKYFEYQNEITTEVYKVYDWYRDNINPKLTNRAYYEEIDELFVYFIIREDEHLCLPIHLLYGETEREAYLEEFKERELRKKQIKEENNKKRMENSREKRYKRYLELKREFEDSVSMIK